jgi:Helix-turn-helix family
MGAMDFARALWQRIETIHAVTYFDPLATEATTAAGLTGFWMGYFGARAAPMGAVGAGVVEATFFNFAPGFVRRWVPDIWERSSPATLLEARSDAAARSLRAISPDVDTLADAIGDDLARAVERCSPAGRPLFAANREAPVPDDPVAALWQYCTSLREHRGDGHVAALTAAGLDGLEAHVLIALDGGTSAEDLQKTRGWTSDDWDGAARRCEEQGLVAAGTLTEAGQRLRAEVEATTDRLATVPFAALTEPDRAALLDALEPVAVAVSRSGIIRYPNPIGVPPL